MNAQLTSDIIWKWPDLEGTISAYEFHTQKDEIFNRKQKKIPVFCMYNRHTNLVICPVFQFVANCNRIPKWNQNFPSKIRPFTTFLATFQAYW